jgi:hypothetical protein
LLSNPKIFEFGNRAAVAALPKSGHAAFRPFLRTGSFARPSAGGVEVSLVPRIVFLVQVLEAQRTDGGSSRLNGSSDARRRPVHDGSFNAAVSTGSFRKRFPVAAKIALVTAGTIAEVPASPIPPGGSVFWTMYTSTAGASFMRSTW